jgi:hypothetical protein
MIKIKLTEEEFYALKNILNEICHGIKIHNFEKVIGEEKKVVVDFFDKIFEKDLENGDIITLDYDELLFLKKSFDEVFRQIDDWEFEMRIGISKNQAFIIKEKLDEKIDCSHE